MAFPLHSNLIDEVHDLTLACLCGEATAEDVKRLEELLQNNDKARHIYTHTILDSFRLRRWAAATELHSDDISDVCESDAAFLRSAISEEEMIEALPYKTIARAESDDSNSHTPSPCLDLLNSGILGTPGYFSSGWPVAYLVATVIVGIGLVVGALVQVSRPVQVARQSAPVGASNPQSPIPNPSPKAPCVGRITGMVDCRWERKGLGIRDWGLEEGSGVRGQGSDLPSPSGRGAGGEGRRVASGQWSVASKSEMSSLTTSHWPLATSHLVSLGDTFALTSGLMEITYDTGAKVILQGPVTYEVESRNSGYLSVGKLTARVEKKVASGQWPVASKSEMSSLTTSHWPLATNTNPQSLIPNPSSLSTIHYPLFTVRTPTAIVTDLGTEFGVTVSTQEVTEVHVLEGVIDAEIVARDGAIGGHQRVTEGHAVQIKSKSTAVETMAFAPQSFARKLQRAIDTPTEAAYIKAVLADKPMGYWPLNEAAGARRFLDRSGNGIHGYAMGRPSAGQAGPQSDGSRAVVFNGRDYIDFGRRDQFALKNDFTVEAWVWIGDVRRCSTIISALGHDDTGPIGWGLMAGDMGLDARERTGKPVVFAFSPFQVGHFNFTFPGGESITGRWLHVAVGFDRANTAHLYLDGKHRESVTIGKPGRVGPVGLQIGCNDVDDRDFWHGRLAHVAVYPRVLNEQQIQNHYQQCNNGGKEVNGKHP